MEDYLTLGRFGQTSTLLLIHIDTLGIKMSKVGFEELFFSSGGKPINYMGNQLQMLDAISIDGCEVFELTIISTNSVWRQGLKLEFNGLFRINGKSRGSAINIWSDTAPKIIRFEVQSEVPTPLYVRNIWDVGDGVVHSWHAGAAMIVEKECKVRIYRCNDGKIDDDFDDIIFKLEQL
jgi:hypothetical protein